MTMTGRDPYEAYCQLVMQSLHPTTALVDGEPAAMWGDAADSFLLPSYAHLWFLIRAGVPRPAHLIARGAMPFVAQMQACYGRLVTTVAWGHDRDHRWVRWLGFRRWPVGDNRIRDAVFLAYERV